MSENILVDPNTADEETLAQIPGVGEEIAKRILNARPYASLDDLQRVNGIGPVFLENILPYLALSPDDTESVGEDEAAVEEETETKAVFEEETSPEEEVVSIEPEPSPEVEAPPEEIKAPPKADVTPPEKEAPPEEEPVILVIEPTDEEEVPSPEKAPPTEAVAVPTKPEPALVTRSQALWISFASGVLAFVFAMAIIFGILAGVNGGLKFATPTQVQEVSHQLNGLSTQFDVLGGDLEGLRKRLDNLEGLSGRVDAVETTAKQLESDLGNMRVQIEGLSQQVDDLETQVDDLEVQVVTLQEQSSRFQDFFDGLRDLLDNLYPSEVTK